MVTGHLRVRVSELSIQRVPSRLQIVLIAFDFAGTASMSKRLQDPSLMLLLSIGFRVYQLFNLPELIFYDVIFVCSQCHDILSTYQLML